MSNYWKKYMLRKKKKVFYWRTFTQKLNTNLKKRRKGIIAMFIQKGVQNKNKLF